MKRLFVTALLACTVSVANAGVAIITFDTIGLVGYDEPNFYEEDGYTFRIVPTLSVSNHLDGTDPLLLHTDTVDGGFRVESLRGRFSIVSVDYSITAFAGAYIAADDGRDFQLSSTTDDSLVSSRVGLTNIRWAEFRINGGGGYLFLDNLTVQSVSAPPTAALLLSGFLLMTGLGMPTRKK